MRLWRPTQQDAETLERVHELKANLQRHPTLEAAQALERSWRPERGSVLDLSQLEGEWEMRSPSEQERGWMSGDVLRMVFSMYQSGVGKMLRMELPVAPKLLIKQDGNTEMKMHLRWGDKHDSIKLFSTIQIAEPNKISAKPGSVRSAALWLTLPALQRERKLRVTFFDGEVLVLRDEKAVVDIFWRPHVHVRSDRPQRQEAAQPSPASAGEDNALDSDAAPGAEWWEAEIGELSAKVEFLKQALEEQREQASVDGAERGMLRGEIARLETIAETATLEAKGHVVTLDVMDSLANKLAEAAGAQRQKSSAKDEARAQLQDEVSSLQEASLELEDQLGKFIARGTSLREQVQVFEDQRQVGPRDSWPGYLSAITRSSTELAEVRAQVSGAKKAAISLKKELARKERQLRSVAVAAEAEAFERAVLEAQLEDRKQEIAAQELRLREAEASQASLRSELEQVRCQFATVEAREAEHRDQVLAVQSEIGDIIAQARAAQELQSAEKNTSTTTRRKWWR